MQVEREHAHEARQRFDAGHHEGRGRQHDLAFAQPVAVDLGFGEMGDEVVLRTGAARGHFGGEEVAQLLEGRDVLGGAALDGLVGRDREDHLAPDVGMIALGQAHGAKQQPDGDLAGEVVDEFEGLAVADAVERAVGDLVGGRDEMLGRLCG